MRPGLVALLIAAAGCSTALGPVGVMVPDGDAVGVKLLVPGAVGRSCRASIFGVPLTAGDPTLAEALAGILARDAEGNVVTGAEVRWERVVTGVYNRRCVEVQGDLARSITTVRLPAPPGHHGHH